LPENALIYSFEEIETYEDKNNPVCADRCAVYFMCQSIYSCGSCNPEFQKVPSDEVISDAFEKCAANGNIQTFPFTAVLIF